MKWVLMPLQKYADFNGRACRMEYWMFTLAVTALYVLGAGLLVALESVSETLALVLTVIFLIALFALIVPSLSVAVRRLHDTGRSGWWYLLTFVPVISLVLLVLMLLDSEPGENQYGPNPKDEH